MDDELIDDAPAVRLEPFEPCFECPDPGLCAAEAECPRETSC